MKNSITLLMLIFFIFSAKSQNLKILKDSIFIDSSYLIIEELKININNEKVTNKIYAITQSTYEILDKPFLGKPEERIKKKKDSINIRILENSLRELNTGFENYEIYFDRNNIINISIALQSYGSPWEAIQYYCFDLKNGERVGVDLFVKKQILLEKIRKKLNQKNINLSLKLNDLLNFKIITDKERNISGINFSIFDTKNLRNSGYEEHIINFKKNEIIKHISSKYRARFFE
jgi:hypothetical protein